MKSKGQVLREKLWRLWLENPDAVVCICKPELAQPYIKPTEAQLGHKPKQPIWYIEQLKKMKPLDWQRMYQGQWHVNNGVDTSD